MLHKLRTAWGLSAADCRLFLQAWLLLPAIDLALRRLPFLTLQQRLAAWSAVEAPPPSDPQTLIDRAAAAVDRATRNHPVHYTCLRRALALQFLLARRGLCTELRFGVRKTDGRLEAHAWLEYAGRPVSQPESVEASFTVLTNPIAARPPAGPPAQ